jgi:hypothetical protein
VLHIRPWEQRDRLTIPEFLGACAYIDQLNAKAREAAGE